MIRDNNIGLVSLASDQDKFNKNLNKMISDKKMREVQGKNAYTLFNAKFNVNAAYTQIIEHFK